MHLKFLFCSFACLDQGLCLNLNKMNANVKELYRIASAPERKIIGLMSGTSLDGLDIAYCSFSGSGLDTKVKVLDFTTVPYSPEIRSKIKNIFAKRDADLQEVCLLNEMLGALHAQMILSTLGSWKIDSSQVDLIASHGQTVFHAPKILHNRASYPNGTLQIGDGDHISVGTGIITLSDFRQKHIAAGGEGAPLAVYGDYLIFSKEGENRIMLNIGGISNFTFLPGDRDASKVFSTDAGPGNTLMDQYIQKAAPGKYFDENAEMSLSGDLSEPLLNALLDDPFFSGDLPKTTGPELFNLAYLNRAISKAGDPVLSNADLMATLCHFSARAISDAINKCSNAGDELNIYMSGGGMHNPLLTRLMKQQVPYARFMSTETLGINPDAKEALLFALLANEAVAGQPVDFGNRKGVPSICMGKISMPS